MKWQNLLESIIKSFEKNLKETVLIANPIPTNRLKKRKLDNYLYNFWKTKEEKRFGLIWYFAVFFLSEFSFANIHNSQDSRR